jgi:clorobiocin biosynthesis protein CloN6
VTTCTTEPAAGALAEMPCIQADLLLVHAPAFFDFRERSDVYFPYLSTSGDVPITPLYEYFPVGFKTLQRHLGQQGHDVKILNISSLLLRYPKIDLRTFLGSVDAKIFGIDLHWMIHVQGSLAIAELIKSIYPDRPIVFGGISSTYYAQELVRYPFIDMVMRGYDTHAPMTALLKCMDTGTGFDGVENLLWKNAAGEVIDNGLSHIPDTFSCGIDWSHMPAGKPKNTLPILEVLSTQNAGCAYN